MSLSYHKAKLGQGNCRCACGRPAVDYAAGYRCARCKAFEDAERTRDTDPAERARRLRLDRGLPEYALLMPTHHARGLNA